jgi:iron complex outermembrane receptor protein
MAMNGTAAAQDNAPASNNPDANENKAIVVTAQRREQTLLSVPLAISAIEGEILTSTGVTNLTGLRFNTPGYSSVTGTGYTQIYIRGIGNRIFVGADPSVATFIDDVPRVFASLVDDLAFVERVEVLKGAQGGLYGRNATGGVINIITRQPSDEFAAEARIEYGTKDTLDANLYVNIPLSESIAFNVVASRKSHDDYTPNKAIANPYQSYRDLSAAEAAAFGDTGQRQFLIDNPGLAEALDAPTAVSDMNNQDFWFVDSKLRIEGEGFKVTLAGDYQEGDDANGNGWIQATDISPAPFIYQFLMGGTGAFVFGQPTAGAALPFDYLYPQTDGKFDTFGSITHHALQKDYGISAKVDVDFDALTLTSITARRWNQSQFRGDIGAANVPIAGFETNFKRRNFFQELRAVSSGDGPFRWLGGATYYNERIDNLLASIVLGVPFSPTTAVTKTDSWSVYAQGEYDLTDRLTITASLRYVDEKKVGTYPAQTVSVFNYADNTPVPGFPMGLVNGVAVPEGKGKTTVTKLLPSVNISYDVGDGVAYLRWARGLKTGGVNPLVHPAQTLNEVNAFEPEQVDTFEAGLRMSLFNRKVQLTSAIFYNDYKNLQVTKTGYSGLPFVLFNAGSAETYGAELGLDWRVTNYLSIQANVGYLKAKYKDFACLGDGTYCIPELQVPAFDSSGNQLVQSPEWQGGISALLDVPVTDNWNFAASMLFSFSSSFFPDDENKPRHPPAGQTCFAIGGCGLPQKAYQLLNLRAGVHTADDRIGIYVSARNVFNKFYQAFGTSSNTAVYQIPGAPRIITAQLVLKY